jgi:tetratricopeptide (TPR) repeat protein
MADRLRSLWDFDDLDATEKRFRAQLDREGSGAGRAELLTQLARVCGLRGDFDECTRLLDRAEALGGANPSAGIRLELERGRMLRSSGDRQAAFPLFQSAYERAVGAGEHYLAGDAAHMAALAAVDRDAMEEWTRLGLELGERNPDAAYWAGPLLNNLAWAYYEAEEYDRALELFRRALEARERDPENDSAIAWARYGVGQALRALGRADEAVAMLEPAVEWAQRVGDRDGYFHEELAEDYAAAGRLHEAGEEAKLALKQIDTHAEPERAARLSELAAQDAVVSNRSSPSSGSVSQGASERT